MAVRPPPVRRQTWKAYPVQNGGLANSTLGPSSVRGCPQQNQSDKPMPRSGSTNGKARAAQPESGPRHDRSPTIAPQANIPSKKTTSAGMISLLRWRAWIFPGMVTSRNAPGVDDGRLLWCGQVAFRLPLPKLFALRVARLSRIQETSLLFVPLASAAQLLDATKSHTHASHEATGHWKSAGT